VAPPEEQLADRAVGWLTSAIARAWFSEVEVEGLDGLPSGPLIVAANHPNGFVDPVLLRAHLPRPVRFLAKQALWRIPAIGSLLNVVGALPVERAQDGDTSGNASTFAAADRVLGDGGAIAVFPEGEVQDDGRMKRLRTGTARIALGARAAGVRGVHVTPVGLIYAEQTAPRERALVRAGQPIDVDAFAQQWEADKGAQVGEDSRDAVNALTAALTERLRAAAVDYADRAEALALIDAAMIRQRATGGELRHDGQAPLGAVEPQVRRLAAAPEEDRRAVLDALATYRLRLALLHLDDAGIELGARAARKHALVALTVVAALTPLALPGLVVNLPPYLLVDQLADRPLARASRANFQVLASLITFPLAWVGWDLILRRLGVRRPWPWIAVTGPVGGLAALAAAERVRQLGRSRLALKALLRNPDQLPDLLALRATLVDAVDKALTAEPSSPADPGSAVEPTSAVDPTSAAEPPLAVDPTSADERAPSADDPRA
jgi:1-acyl-sn-glycerol-3-phosphate acyltransferase